MASMRALARDGKGGVRRFGICQDFSVGLCYQQTALALGQGAWTLIVSSFILTLHFKTLDFKPYEG